MTDAAAKGQTAKPSRRRKAESAEPAAVADLPATDNPAEISDDTSGPSTDANGAEPPAQVIPADVSPPTATADAEPATLFTTILSDPGPAEASPDGSTLAYLQADENGLLRLWLHPTDGSAPRELPVPIALHDDRDPDTGRQLRGPQWSPDGTRLAVISNHPHDSGTAVWLIPVDGDEPQLLVDHPAADRSPRWSPDGARLAFVSRRGGRDSISLAPADGSGPVMALTAGPRDDREPVWAPDGGQIAFCRQSAEDWDHADIVVVDVATGEERVLTATKTSAVRHSLDWAPGRNMVIYVTVDGDWQTLAVINTDNNAGWVVTKESGVKAAPRWAPKGNRLVYTRSEGLTTVCCERGLHAGSAVALDPGEGEARFPCWLDAERIAYAFSTPSEPFRFLIQERTKDAERTTLPPTQQVDRDGFASIRPWPLTFDTGPDEQLAGLLYRRGEGSGPSPAIIYLPDGPLAARTGRLQPEEQALAAGGMAVFTPTVRGASGFGRAVADGLQARADTEIEVSDIADAAAALTVRDEIAGDMLAIVGAGLGGTLALLAAGGRAGTFRAVVAIDPITDWDIELDQATAVWRRWIVSRLGLPVAYPGRYALREPATFAAVIDAPLLLIGTATAPPARQVQLETFAGLLTELGVPFEQEEAAAEPLAATLHRAQRWIALHMQEGLATEEAAEP